MIKGHLKGITIYYDLLRSSTIISTFVAFPALRPAKVIDVAGGDKVPRKGGPGTLAPCRKGLRTIFRQVLPWEYENMWYIYHSCPSGTGTYIIAVLVVPHVRSG